MEYFVVESAAIEAGTRAFRGSEKLHSTQINIIA